MSLRDDDFFFCTFQFCDSLRRNFKRRKGQRTDLKKTDERQGDACTEEDKETEGRMGDDEGKDGQDGEDSKHEIFVITWNVNKSSAQVIF